MRISIAVRRCSPTDSTAGDARTMYNGGFGLSFRPVLGGRPTVGHVALDHGIGVRIPASQPLHSLRSFCCSAGSRLRAAHSRSPRSARIPASQPLPRSRSLVAARPSSRLRAARLISPRSARIPASQPLHSLRSFVAARPSSWLRAAHLTAVRRARHESLPPSHFTRFARSWLLDRVLGFARLTSQRFAALGTNPASQPLHCFARLRTASSRQASRSNFRWLSLSKEISLPKGRRRSARDPTPRTDVSTL